jgi:hypothetical protein
MLGLSQQEFRQAKRLERQFDKKRRDELAMTQPASSATATGGSRFDVLITLPTDGGEWKVQRSRAKRTTTEGSSSKQSDLTFGYKTEKKVKKGSYGQGGLPPLSNGSGKKNRKH